MIRFEGVGKILAFNYPWYLGALALNGAAWFAWRSVAGNAPVAGGIALAAAAADFWLIASLAVSWYVYDVSPLARGAWLESLDPGRIRSAAVFHAGQDEASRAAARRLPGAELRAFDFHRPGKNGTLSLRRARASAGETGAVRMEGYRPPLGAGSLDLALLAFSAHEIRDAEGRATLFRELARVLSGTGRILVVEHLRDGWNLAAYGPGAFHFLPRSAWLRAFADGGLRVAREKACTPFVRIFELERGA